MIVTTQINRNEKMGKTMSQQSLLQKLTIKSVTSRVVLLLACSFSVLSNAQEIQIGALVSGQVSQVFVSEGQSVKKGQSLINLDTARYEAKLKMLQAQKVIAKARLADAQIELDQALDLFDRTVTSKRTRDAAQLAFDIAQNRHLVAESELGLHQTWARYVYIKSPMNAKVVKIFAPVGTTVYKENTPLIKLAD